MKSNVEKPRKAEAQESQPAQSGAIRRSKTRDHFRSGDLFAPPQSKRAGGVPPTPQAAAPARPRQLWYAVVFPTLSDTDTESMQRLCMHAQEFTSFVSIEPPNALLLEIRGSLKLFGPAQNLHARIDECWRRLAWKGSSATAPSTLAALWLARGPLRAARQRVAAPVIVEDLSALASRLAGLPIACTGWDLECLRTLCSMGVMHVGELLRLPRDGLARRLGAGLLRDLDITMARQGAPRRIFVPRERFRERCDFEAEVEHVACLEAAAEPLIGRCARFLRRRQAGIQRLRLKLEHRSEPRTEITLGLASVTSERRRLMDVLSQKLVRLELAAPVRGMELVSGPLRPLSADSFDAFAGSKHGSRDTAPQLVERLRARLGDDAVYGLISIPEHRPEAAWRRVHELDPASTGRRADKERASLDIGMPRPVWLLAEPLPLKSGFVLEEGPERIESGWWDGRGVARDYYVARQVSKRAGPASTDAGSHHPRRDGASGCGGARLWIFQERRTKHWFLHGVFA